MTPHITPYIRKFLFLVIFAFCKNVYSDSLAGDLVSASENGDNKKIVELLNNGSDVNGRYFSSTALNTAIIKGRVDTVLLLLKMGADPNLPDATSTPLIKAVSSFESASIVSLLLKNGADPNLQFGNAKDRDGPLGFLTKQINSNEADQVKSLQLLLQAGANVDASATDGGTPLHNVILLNRVDLAKALLEAGANPNLIQHASIPDFSTGESPLQTAIVSYGTSKDTSMAKLLLKFGANANFRNDREFEQNRHQDESASWNGLTPLFIATQLGYTPLMPLLLESGADACLSRSDGASLSEIAAMGKNKHMTTFLANYFKKHPCQKKSIDAPLKK